MIPRELLEQLRALNEVGRDVQRAGLNDSERARMAERVGALRAKLPTALLAQHDRLVRRGSASVAPIAGSACGGCHMRLPVGLLAELHQPGRIGVCPHCGVFLFCEPGATVPPSS